MMITSQLVNHKRQLHDGFVFSKGHNDGSGEKRLKHDGGAEANISTRKKDKIGERVTKLQQLVSPFGKSDTASVLSEAAEYIRFLHDQIQHLMQLSALQVLSAPYLQTTVTGNMEDGDCYSLRRRGLCLMPIASTLTIAQSNGADIWAPVNSNRSP